MRHTTYINEYLVGLFVDGQMAILLSLSFQLSAVVYNGWSVGVLLACITGDYCARPWTGLLQRAPIKNNPFGKIYYLRNCNRFCH